MHLMETFAIGTVDIIKMIMTSLEPNVTVQLVS